MVFYYAALSFYCFISIFILKNLIVLVKKYHKNDHNYLIILKNVVSLQLEIVMAFF